jgi:hypothetical protein
MGSTDGKYPHSPCLFSREALGNVPWPRMDPRGGFTINHYCLLHMYVYFADAVIQGPRLQGWLAQSHLVGFSTIRGYLYVEADSDSDSHDARTANPAITKYASSTTKSSNLYHGIRPLRRCEWLTWDPPSWPCGWDGRIIWEKALSSHLRVPSVLVWVSETTQFWTFCEVTSRSEAASDGPTLVHT